MVEIIHIFAVFSNGSLRIPETIMIKVDFFDFHNMLAPLDTEFKMLLDDALEKIPHNFHFLS